MKVLIFIAMTLVIYSCQSTSELNYPESRKENIVDTYFGVQVSDPYRWLEDDLSNETAAWVGAQNKLTFGYLDQIPFKDELQKRLEHLWDYEKISAPFEEGDYTYFYKNSGLQNHYVLYRKKENEKPQVFLDPNSFSEDGTTALAGLSFSKNGHLLAYSISEGGSDWRKIITMDVHTHKQVGDTLVDVKFSGVSWKGDEGFFYSSYDKPKGSELSAKTDQHKLYYHKLGTPQSDDILVFGGDEKHRYVGGRVTEDARYLMISASKSTSGNKLFLKDLQDLNGPLITILDHFDSDTYLLDNDGNTLYLVTNLDAPNKKIIRTKASNPQPKHWVDVVPETEHVLVPSKGSGYFFAEYMIDAISKVYQYNYEGKAIREVQLPGLGSAGGFRGKKDQKTLYFSFSNYFTPGSYFAYDPKTGKSTTYWKPNIPFSPDDYESKQVFFNSKDGTKVPMIITYKKGIRLNGKNPTMLYGYGGFNISLTPSFSVVNATWMSLGGVYAVPNLRGGGEYGKSWHKAGTQMQKQNVFDDFIAAAEHLFEEGYTSPEYLAIRGGSNGGLLVGATMTQRPDLAKVALPAVGVLDMLRYHTFTAGAGWAYDYGTSEQSEEMFQYLKGYSPLHNIEQETHYPATLVTTGDHDDRVVPAHSFKFAATLQEKHQGDNPVLIRVETDAGHGAGTPTSKSIALYADVLGFTLYNMGFRSLPK